jgi:hypothetical protein
MSCAASSWEQMVDTVIFRLNFPKKFSAGFFQKLLKNNYLVAVTKPF